MKWYLWIVAVLVGASAVALGQDPTASVTPFAAITDAIADVTATATAVKGGGLVAWMALTAALLKSFWMLVGRVPPLHKKVVEWGVEVNVLIPALVAVAYKIGGGDGWVEVVLLIATGPIMGFMHDAATYVWKLKKAAGPASTEG